MKDKKYDSLTAESRASSYVLIGLICLVVIFCFAVANKEEDNYVPTGEKIQHHPTKCRCEENK